MRALERWGWEAARRAGRGDERRGLSSVAVVSAAGAFVCLFMPWLSFAGHAQAGWGLPLGAYFGLLALASVLVEVATARSDVVAFCLDAAAGIVGISAVANLRWGGFLGSGFSVFAYGAWLGLACAIPLIGVAALRLAVLRRSAP
jgi:hypothetical protein